MSNIINEMELVKNINDESSFDPTPKLKSSPIPILFVPFNELDDDCFNCGDRYTECEDTYATLILQQKYCKKCILRYITDITDNNTYLEVTLRTCGQHETCGCINV